MPILRRKSFKYKANKVSKNYKTNRTKLSSVARAFAVSALTAMRGDYASQRALATHMGRAQSTLSELLLRTEEKAALKTVAL
jgi:phosphoheptose isomerase